MSAEIIPFPVPGLIERVAHRMLPAMKQPPGARRDEAKDRVFLELSAGAENEFRLSVEQWSAVWRRVDELMSANEAANG